MRSIYTSGKRKGKVTKSSKKGTPWSEVWDGEMGRCNGEGKWFGEELDEWAAEHGSEEDGGLEIEEDAEVDELKRQDGRGLVERDEVLAAMNCSPVTVIYGHAGGSRGLCPGEWMPINAAGRGLDIKPFSKGLDTGCVVSCL